MTPRRSANSSRSSGPPRECATSSRSGSGGGGRSHEVTAGTPTRLAYRRPLAGVDLPRALGRPRPLAAEASPQGGAAGHPAYEHKRGVKAVKASAQGDAVAAKMLSVLAAINRMIRQRQACSLL